MNNRKPPQAAAKGPAVLPEECPSSSASMTNRSAARGDQPQPSPFDRLFPENQSVAEFLESSRGSLASATAKKRHAFRFNNNNNNIRKPPTPQVGANGPPVQPGRRLFSEELEECRPTSHSAAARGDDLRQEPRSSPFDALVQSPANRPAYQATSLARQAPAGTRLAPPRHLNASAAAAYQPTSLARQAPGGTRLAPPRHLNASAAAAYQPTSLARQAPAGNGLAPPRHLKASGLPAARAAPRSVQAEGESNEEYIDRNFSDIDRSALYSEPSPWTQENEMERRKRTAETKRDYNRRYAQMNRSKAADQAQQNAHEREMAELNKQFASQVVDQVADKAHQVVGQVVDQVADKSFNFALQTIGVSTPAHNTQENSANSRATVPRYDSDHTQDVAILGRSFTQGAASHYDSSRTQEAATPQGNVGNDPNSTHLGDRNVVQFHQRELAIPRAGAFDNEANEIYPPIEGRVPHQHPVFGQEFARGEQGPHHQQPMLGGQNNDGEFTSQDGTRRRLFYGGQQYSSAHPDQENEPLQARPAAPEAATYLEKVGDMTLFLARDEEGKCFLYQFDKGPTFTASATAKRIEPFHCKNCKKYREPCHLHCRECKGPGRPCRRHCKKWAL